VLIEVRGELIKDGQVVRSWTNRSPPGWQQVIWDGTNDRGNRVEDGVYTIKITATDKAQNASANESQWVVVDTTPPEIRNIASSGIFSPNSDGEFDADNLTFDLTDNLSPSLINTIEVVDNSDRLIARLGEGRGPSTVPCSLSTAWDGLTLSGWVAPDNTYKYLISAEDLAGNSAVSDSTLVTVDTTPPQIVDLTSAISKLSFTESSGSLDLRFRILESSGRANVFASILDARGGIVQNYPITCEADRQYQISWNGRDSFGFFVPDHSYVYYRFYATDCVANRRYSDNDQLIRVETPYTGVYGNVIYSPDGEVKIIIPQGAVSEEAELSIEMRDTPPRSYRVAENDNITLTYEFLPEGLIFNKPCTLMFHYNPGVLNFPDQPVLPYQYSTTDGWKQLAGNIRNNVFNSFIDKTGTLVMGADLTPPPTPIVNPPPSPTGSDLITVSGTAEHDSIVNLNVNGTLYTKLVRSPDWSISNVNLAEGENLISATARDSAGNTSSPSAVLSAFKDTTPPLLSRLNDEILYASPAAHFSASASDAGCPTCEVWLIIQSPAGRQILQEKRDNNLEYDWSSSGQAEGAYPYNIQAVDGLDNFSQRSGSVIVDKTAPYALLELLPLNYYLSGNLEIWGSVEDQNFSSWIIDYGTGVSPSSFTEIARGYASRGYGLMANFDTHLLPSGIYTFRLTAYDRAGNNKSILKSKHIINSPIMAHVFSPAVNEHIREVKNIQGSISIVPSEFSCYYLEYGVGFAPSSWTIIYESSTLPTTPDLGSWNTRALSDGSYALRLRAVNLGGENFIFEVPVTIDNTDPVTAITYPTSIEVLGGVISISGTAADENFANYKVEYGEGINPLSWNEVITSPNLVSSGTLASWISGSLNGTHSIRVTAFDKAGNSTSSQVSLTVDNYIDASLDYPSTGMVLADTITIRGTAADINFREYYLEYGRGSNPLTFTRIGEINHTQVTADVLGSWDTRTVADGTYTLRLVVHDQANNEIIKSAVIIVDNTYPTVSISDPRVGDYLAGVVNIAGTAYDDNIQSSLLEYQDNSVPGTWHNIYSSAEAQNIQNDTIFNWNAGSFNGSHTIRVSVTDKTGKTSRAEVSVILDNIRPMISITSPSRESVNTGALEIVGEISDINLKNYLIKYGAGIEPTQFWELKSSASSQVGTLYTWQTTNVKDGYYTLRYEAEDKAGNKSSYEFPIIIDNAPAIAEIQEPIANQVVRGTIDIKGIACDADFTTYNFKRYEILYGQGSLPASWTTLESLAVPKINETLTSWNTVGLTDGTYSLKLRSQDISGITEKTKTLIVDNSLPTLALTAPTDGATLSGNYAVRGTATDVNFREYKIYYQQTGAADWNELNSGSSPVNNSTFFSWNTILLGDGIYRIKLWAKDQAGNESEIIRNVTINNVLDVNNVSLSAGTFSPNGDGLDDRVRLKYNLTENSNVTVKVYRKSSLYTYNWAAFASGTRYPSQDFNYTLSASGVNYPARDFGWRVDANGVENYSVSRSGSITGNDFGNLYTGPPWISFNYRWIDGEKRAVLANGEYHPLRNDVGDEVIAATYIAVYRQWIGANINYGDTFLDVPTPSITVSGDKIRKFNYGSYLEIYDKTGSGSKTRFYMLKEIYDGAGDLVTNGWIVNPSEATFSWSVTGNKSQSVSASDPSSGSKTATKYYNGSISGNSYSVTLSPQYGGTISGKTISYTQTSGSGVSTSRDGSGWIGNTCSGVINADYTYSGNSWTNSTSPNKSVSALEGNKTVSETVASIFGAVGGEPYHTYSSISVSAPSDPDVNLRFNYSGTNSTSRTDDYLIASTPVSQSWTTANHTGGVVGPDGWIRYGPNPLPFYYNEAPESKNVRTITGYAPPSDVIISSWAVNPDNLYATIYGTNANGDFNVRLSDSMLVKTIQYDTLTTAGEHTIEWDGTDNTGSSVGNGDYIFVIYAGGNVVKKGINGEYPVTVQKSAEITASSISETYISPNGDGLKDNANINYTLSQNASSVNIEIRDKDNNVTKMISGPATAGTHYVIWDGSTSAPGISAQDGIYTAKIIVTHSSGAVREKTLTITVDNNNPGISEEEPKVIVYSAAFEENPVYSPDKTKIAYAKEISGKKQICSMDLSTSQVTQLTDQDENKEPSWSPDGSSLGFISNRSGNWDLYKMNTDGSKVKQITANSAAENVPAWSPDGTKLAFGSDRQGHLLLPKWNIWTLNRDGTNPSQVTQDETTFRDETPSWSPDGKKLIYASDQDGNFDIWMVNADSSGKTKITSSSEAETRPAWSPDGLKIAYKNERGLSIYDVRSKAQVQLITAEGLTNPSWSRDGTEIIYNDSAGNIYSKSTYKGGLTGVITYPILSQTLSGLVEIKGTALDTNLEGYKVECSPNITPYIWTEIGSSNVPKKDSILAVWNTAPLSDGQYILKLTAWDRAGNSLENSLIVNSDNDNWKLTIASLTQITTDDAWDIEPAWSPDGSKLAFSSNRSGNYDIWAMNADGSGLINLANNPAYDGKPAWSPNGSKIAFVSDRSGNKDIWTMNIDGSDLKQLTSLTIIDTDPCWSPDSTRIAFASNRSDNYDIWVVNADGSGEPIKIMSSEAYEGEPSWSRAGLAFTSDRSGHKEIWMLNADGTGEAFRLTNNPAESQEPCWSPFAIPLSDGSSRPLITFTSTRQDNSDIYLMDTDGIDQSKSLTDYTNTDCNPAWSPDGGKVAFASFKDNQYDIWVMNFAINTSILSIPTIQQTATLEIISPKDGVKITNLRPTFKWYGIQGHTSYRIVARKDIEVWTQPKNITQTEASPESGARPAIAYPIHEFDYGLNRGIWNWKIQALNSDNSVLAETAEETFEIDPPFTISGITNYPNPFDPNRERTKIRYKLSNEADEVRIRIYDIAGALVNELDGYTNGEGTNIWFKYNDVEWNGRNGRGDLVLNGIYPFEVVARSGGTSVSGRGKIAILK
jgi:Tol biopolymer transport system component/flagellar hook assembly protein FlgD